MVSLLLKSPFHAPHTAETRLEFVFSLAMHSIDSRPKMVPRYFRKTKLLMNTTDFGHTDPIHMDIT